MTLQTTSGCYRKAAGRNICLMGSLSGRSGGRCNLMRCGGCCKGAGNCSGYCCSRCCTLLGIV